MILTARQRKFLQLAARDDGVCPYDMPKRSPFLKNDEISPLETGGLVTYSDKCSAWFTTLKGERALKGEAV